MSTTQHTVTTILLAALTAAGFKETTMAEPKPEAQPARSPAQTEFATLGAGCFWCVEAVYQQLKGVTAVTSGYTGGTVKNPTYEQVCSGRTGHAEVIRVEFDPKQVTYSEILDMFWSMHDPTTPNRQGADVGTQYRSAIFYHSEEQKRIAEESKRKLDASGAHKAKAVTEIVPAGDFYPAENYHQDYYRQNANAPYCRMVIQPKLKKLGLKP